MALSDQPRDDVTDVQALHEVAPQDGAPAHDADASDAADGAEPIELKPLADEPPDDDARKHVRPSMRFVFSHPAHAIGVFFGVGSFPIAAGTVGTLAGWITWLFIAAWLTPVQQAWLVAASIPIGWWACSITARDLRTADPRAAVIDEVVAIWLILWVLWPVGFWGQFWAFVLFRYFDAAKPGPVGWADRVFHGKGVWLGGFGVLFDDLVAAFCTLLVFAIWRVIFHHG
jgi:phosphatidylglycerophosphatase A